jgi:hypothetical protein
MLLLFSIASTHLIVRIFDLHENQTLIFQLRDGLQTFLFRADAMPIFAYRNLIDIYIGLVMQYSDAKYAE